MPTARSLEGTHWRASELAGQATPAQDAATEAHLVFEAGGRVTGSDGCNRITGTYVVKGNAVTFGQLATTQRACLNAPPTAPAFHDALKSGTSFSLVGDRLELLDAAGKRVAVFTARPLTK